MSSNTEVSREILMVKKFAHLLTVVFLVLGINKLVNSQEMGLGIFDSC